MMIIIKKNEDLTFDAYGSILIVTKSTNSCVHTSVVSYALSHVTNQGKTRVVVNNSIPLSVQPVFSSVVLLCYFIKV